MLERGQMIKDYTNQVNDSDDEDDPRTPTSVSSQGSHGYDSADFVDVERFTTIPNSSELNIQVNIEIFEKCRKVNKCFSTLTC